MTASDRAIEIAPRVVFEQLAERATRPRFMVRDREAHWNAITWQMFADEIQQCAMFLREVGVRDNDRVAIFSNNHVPWLSAAFGAQAIGAAMVPIYPTSTEQQAAYVFEHSDAKVVFVGSDALVEKVLLAWTGGEFAFEDAVRVVTFGKTSAEQVLERLIAEGRSTLSWDAIADTFVSWETARKIGAARIEEAPGRFEKLLSEVTLDHTAVMLYTSGTTGRPKGVPLTHRNVGVNGRDWLECNASSIEDEAVDVLWLPMSHIFGFGEACLGNSLGFVSYLSDPVRVLDDLGTVKPTVFMSVPRYYEKIAAAAKNETTFEARDKKLKELTGGRMSFCLSGGAGLKVEIKEFLADHGIIVIEGYGLTEASPTLTLNRPDDYRFDTVGKPLPSVEIKLADDGEILARGENVFSGYHKDADATDAVLEEGWLKTGDLGRFTDDGFLQIIGRKKEILVTAGGKNISPVNIENRFLDDEAIANVVVYGDGEKFLVAGVWLNPLVTLEDPEGTIERRIEEVNAALASYETIKKFRVMEEPLTVENGFLTPTMKVKRNKVYDAFGDRFRELY